MNEEDAYLFKRCIRKMLDTTFIVADKDENYMISYHQSPINMMLIHIWQQLGIKLLLKKESK